MRKIHQRIFYVLSLLVFLIKPNVYASLPAQGHLAQGSIDSWCHEVRAAVSKLNWKLEPCSPKLSWKSLGSSVEGRPLVYIEFGDPHAENTTLIFSTVHGDEITPLYVGLQLVNWIQERLPELDQKTRVVIAPLVNPDGFFHSPKTRMNARGVDVNRNFATKDWKERALVSWKKKFRSDPRRFPGHQPGSEPETRFQEALIHQVKPQKILSIHSPLNFLDYDGPSQLTLEQFPSDYAKSCERLKKTLNAISGGYYPGSLGNYAGQELGIPTVTLELPSADPKKAEKYWQQFLRGIKTVIHFSVPKYASTQLESLPKQVAQ